MILNFKPMIVDKLFYKRTHLKSFNSTLILLFLFSLIFFSCKRADNSERIQKIENLLVELDTINLKLDSIELIDINKYCNNIKSNCNKIGNGIKPSEKRILIRYCNLYGNLQSLNKRNNFLRNSTEARKLQLEKLLYDLKFNPVTEKEFLNYFSFEKSELNQLKHKIQHNLIYGKNNILLYDSLNPIIEKSINPNK